MNEFKCRFDCMVERTHNVKSFRFIPVESGFDYLIGQFVTVVFDENDRSNKNLNKMLSLSCCPNKEYIEVTKKISESDFSKRLMSLNQGDEVLFKGPMGKLTISGLGEKNCFLVGGIGITPVFPMIESIVKEGTVRDANGLKMSKSLGNAIDPLEIIEEYGADALRFSLIVNSGQDLYISKEKFEIGRNFANKC